jgi:amidase
MLADWQSFNAVYGSTSNPWDVTRTPGGSSGGGAASLAAGMSALELGSDIGASIRAPAHFCGVYGHKPSFGIVPQHGHSTPGGRVPSDMSVCGPLARSAEDLALALDIVAGPEPYDRDAWTLKLPGPRKTRLKDLRIALKLDDPNSAVDRGVADRVQAAADALARAGARVDDRARPRIDERRAYALYVQLLRGATGARSSDEAFARSRESAARLAPGDESSSARMLRGVVQDHRSWYVAHEERQQLRFAWAEFFRDYDALLCPAAAMAAFPHDQKVDRAERLLSVNGKQEEFNLHVPGVWAAIATLAYLPATVAPAGRTPAGLPVGVQIVGPYLQDHSTIELARLLARETEGFVAPPAYR